MIHVVFNRPRAVFKVFDEHKELRFEFAAAGDAWGDGVHAPYGHHYPIPPGHYHLTAVDHLDPAIPSEGAAQVHVEDLDAETLALLAAADPQEGIVTRDVATIGGITLPFGELARYGRSAILIHGGGSNAPDPFAPEQVLCKTEGCTRLHNADLATFVAYVEPLLGGEHVIYSVLGDPVALQS